MIFSIKGLIFLHAWGNSHRACKPCKRESPTTGRTFWTQSRTINWSSGIYVPMCFLPNTLMIISPWWVGRRLTKWRLSIWEVSSNQHRALWVQLPFAMWNVALAPRLRAHGALRAITRHGHHKAMSAQIAKLRGGLQCGDFPQSSSVTLCGELSLWSYELRAQRSSDEAAKIVRRGMSPQSPSQGRACGLTNQLVVSCHFRPRDC